MNEGQNQQQLELQNAILSKTVDHLGAQLAQVQIELAQVKAQNDMLGEQMGMLQQVLGQLQQQGGEEPVEEVDAEIVE